MFPSYADHILHFGIVGGSISGLSAAYWLRRAGHIVTIIEKHPIQVFQDQKYGGLRIPPNITRLFKKIDGMEDTFQKKGSLNEGTLFYQEETGEVVGRTLFEEELMADLGSKYYRVPYSDLWNHLYEFCKACDVRFKFDFQVARATFGNPGKEVPKITSTAGEEFHCDVIIGADGHNSTIREMILPDLLHDEDSSDSDELDESSKAAHFPNIEEWVTFSIPLDKVKNDSDLNFLTQHYFGVMWMGDGVAHFSGIEGNDQYVINVFYPFRRFGSDDMDWDSTEPIPVSAEEIEGTECVPLCV
ncbi:hypothetical protein VKT23_004899 [Stygiomarasmius scandens]|uniref:FAD-binding domain-containing protein n=1 Tax=Marasmiellus scandens TaxID=2682957 RepID=A0ABR1JRJ3_9AGAR